MTRRGAALVALSLSPALLAGCGHGPRAYGGSSSTTAETSTTFAQVEYTTPGNEPNVFFEHLQTPRGPLDCVVAGGSVSCDWATLAAPPTTLLTSTTLPG